MSEATPSPANVMTMADILALLPIGEKQVRNLINAKVLPSEGKGTRRTFDWPRVLEAWVDYKISLAFRDGNAGNDNLSEDDAISDPGTRKPEDIRGAMLRKTRAEADLKQLALSRQRSEVVTLADAKLRLDRMLGNLRAKLLSLAPKLANRLEGERNRTARESAIKDELETLCREVSTGSIVDHDASPSPETLDELAASAAPDNPSILRLAELLVAYDDL